jgi:carbon monoxide dehydrogenase subunit G
MGVKGAVSMKIQGSYTFAVTPDALWPLLFDPQVLSRILPGGQTVIRVGEDQFAGKLFVRVGPLSGTYEGTFRLTAVQPQSGYAFDFSAQSKTGQLGGNGRLHLEPHNNHTVLYYETQTEVGGGLQQQATPLLETSARAIVRQSLERLDQLAQTGQLPGEVPAAQPTSRKIALLSQSPAVYGRIALLIATLALLIWGFAKWRQRPPFPQNTPP